MQRFCCLCSHRAQALPRLNPDRSSGAEITALQIKLSAPALCWGLPLPRWGCRLESMSMLQELFPQTGKLNVLLRVDLCWYWTAGWSLDTRLMQPLPAVRKQPAREDYGRAGKKIPLSIRAGLPEPLENYITKKCGRSACWTCIMPPTHLSSSRRLWSS